MKPIKKAASSRRPKKGSVSDEVNLEEAKETNQEPVKPNGPTSYLSGPVKDNVGCTYFSRVDLQRLENAQLKATNAKQASELQQAKIDIFRAEVATKLQEARDNLSRLALEYQSKADAVANLYRDIESVYGIDMSRISYDPITGKISKLPG